MNETSFVFLDTHGKRWPRFRLVALLAMLLFFGGLVWFARSLLILPRLDEVTRIREMASTLRSMDGNAPVPYEVKPLPVWVNAVPVGVRPPPPSSSAPDRPVRLGFYAGWDPASLESLTQHAGQLTHVAPEWFSLQNVSADLVEEPDPRVLEVAVEQGVALLPLLHNLKGSAWQPEAVENLARADLETQQRFAANLAARLREISAAGILIDWEEVDSYYRDQLTALIGVVHATLRAEGLELWLCIPVGNDLKVFDLEGLATHVDRFVALLFDETGESDAPGPISSQPWFAEWLRVLLRHGQPSQWVIGIGAYAYDWGADGQAESISFADVMARAASAGEGMVANVSPYAGPAFAYTEAGVKHTVWFLDALTFLNQSTAVAGSRAGGLAIQRLGTEDPQVWEALACGAACASPAFEHFDTGGRTGHVGKGDFVNAQRKNLAGERVVHRDNAGFWSTQYYSYPCSTVLYHEGEDDAHRVAITFDDGPDPQWTPAILDILREKGVRAAFFVTGANAAEHPALLRRIIAEGHELGNHTYTHPDLAEVSAARVRLELNATQRVIEAATGFSTLLFRPPYHADRRPYSAAELAPLLAAQQMGYAPVTESIDLEDWREPQVDTLLQRLRSRRGEGNVVLMHDAGGDRSQTVAALPAVIDYLRDRGDTLVPLHQLLGVTRDTLLPPISVNDSVEARVVSGTGFGILHVAEQFLWAFMIAGTILVLIRTGIVVVLAMLHRRRDGQTGAAVRMAPQGVQPLSVIVSAYNEEKVIAATLASVLATDYPGELELIVVDDGSTDRTAAVVGSLQAEDGRIRLLGQPNRGKAEALRAALAVARHDCIVTLDADTHFELETIGRLVAPFDDPRVGAVSGHVKVGNARSWIARFQALEYTCGFNLDRRAYDIWNCITVVPGAGSAFRRQAILAAGGISGDTMAEDTDLTLAIHRAGYRVAYCAQAVAWTEAPETVGALAKQRIRWAFGTLQCLWKHRDLTFAREFGALGLFSLPSVWFFQLFLVGMIPVVDFLLAASLLTGFGTEIAVYALVFLLTDLVLAVAACLMEGEPVRRSLYMIPMRIVYRPLLSWAVWGAFLRALRGAWVGWGKLERRGLVAGRREEKEVCA